MLELTTLGGLAIQRDGEPVSGLATRKVEALLVYLACTHRPHAREVLSEIFWAERLPEPALGNLRVALTSLRKHLGPYLDINRGTIAMAPGADVRLDAAMVTALGCKETIVIPLALKDGTIPEAASDVIKGYAGQGAEVYCLQAVAHNPAVVVEGVGTEAPATPLPTPSPLDKEPPGSVLEGRNAWG